MKDKEIVMVSKEEFDILLKYKELSTDKFLKELLFSNKVQKHFE